MIVTDLFESAPEQGMAEDANPNYIWIQGDFDGDTATTGSKQGSLLDKQTTQVKLTRGRMSNVRPLSGPPTESGKTIKQDQIPLTLDAGNQKFSTTGIDLQLTVAPNGYMSQGGVGRVLGTAVVKIMRPGNVPESLGDLRPALGSKRDQGKSVRKWRKARGMDESGMAEAHGNYAGDTPVNLGGVSMKMIQAGDTVRYIDQQAQVVDMSPDRKYSRITIPSSSTTKNVLTSDLKQLGQGMRESDDEQLDELSFKDIQRGARKISQGAKKFTKNVADTGAAIGGAAGDIGGAIKQVGKTVIADPVAATYNATKSGLNKAADVAAGTYGDLKAGVQKVGAAGKAVGTDIGDAGTAVGKGLQSVGRGIANVAGGVGQGVGATLGGATTGLGRATAKGFNTGVQNVGGNAVDRLQTNVFTIKKQIDTKKAEIQDLEAQLSKAKPAPAYLSKQFSAQVPNPATGKPWTQAELAAQAAPAATNATATTATTATPFQVPGAVTNPGTVKPAAATAADTFPGENPQGAGYVGRLEVARRQAARNAQAAKKPAAPNFGQQNTGYKSVNNVPKTSDAMAETRIATALKKPVAEMLQMVETKEDVQRIKKFVDDTFVKHGAVNESAFTVRNQILELVTQVGAQRRRDFAAQQAH